MLPDVNTKLPFEVGAVESIPVVVLRLNVFITSLLQAKYRFCSQNAGVMKQWSLGCTGPPPPTAFCRSWMIWLFEPVLMCPMLSRLTT